MNMIEELKRVVRHAIAPGVVWLVTAGYVPESMANPIAESAAALITYGLVLLWSKNREAASA